MTQVIEFEPDMYRSTGKGWVVYTTVENGDPVKFSSVKAYETEDQAKEAAITLVKRFKENWQ